MSSVIDPPIIIAPTDARHRATRWRVVDGPEFDPVFVEDVANHLRLSTDQANAESSTLELLISAATDYAETLMNTSLMPRVIEATFYRHEPLILPRGPVLDVNSVTDGNGVDTIAYTIEHAGRSAKIAPTIGIVYPVTVTYRAGYVSFEAVPASIRLAIMAHVGTLYEARESTSENPRAVVPHSLADFYRLNSRSVGIG